MTEPSSPKPNRPFARAGLVMLGLLVVASVPLVALGQRTPPPPPPPRSQPPPPPRSQPQPQPPAVAPAKFDCRPVKKDESVGDEQYAVPLPPFSNNVFPCSRCHDKPTDFNMTPRNLTLDHLNVKLNHGPREQWCYGCHSPTNRDTLRLAGGREISFSKSYELCGQCHGEKLRDWRLGIHGRRTGCWNGKREYLLCVHCHNQHSPKFEALEPKPRPRRPDEIKLGGAR